MRKQAYEKSVLLGTRDLLILGRRRCYRHKTCRRNFGREVEPDLLELVECGLILCCGCAAIGAIHAQNAPQILAIAQLLRERQVFLQAAIDEAGPRRVDCSEARKYSIAELRAPWRW